MMSQASRICSAWAVSSVAVICGMPISISCGMRWVPIKPLAVPPQTKKLPQSNQNVGLLITSRAVIVAFFADIPRSEAVPPAAAAFGSPAP